MKEAEGTGLSLAVFRKFAPFQDLRRKSLIDRDLGLSRYCPLVPIVSRCGGANPGQNRDNFLERVQFISNALPRVRISQGVLLGLSLLAVFGLAISRRTNRNPIMAASYARYSSEMQGDDSLRDQQRCCREAAIKNGHEIDCTHEYADSAVSGTKRDREGINRLLADAEAGEFATLYIHSLSRLARESVITMPMLKRLVHKFDVRVICLSDNIDTNQNGWELLASIMAVMHEQYIKDLGANVLRGQEGTLLADSSVGDYCFGYSSEPIQGGDQVRRGKNAKPPMRYVIHEENANWVRQVFRWYVDEERSLTWIAKKLTKLGAPKDHRSTSPSWHASLVGKLLRREKYIGKWTWGKARNVRDPETGNIHQELRDDDEIKKWERNFEHLRIIDDDLFFGAQQRLDANVASNQEKRRKNGQWKTGGGNNSSPRHLLSGLIVCAECGSKFYVGGANGKYLFCPNYKRGSCSCKTTLRRDLAERLILETVANCLQNDQAWFDALFASVNEAWKELNSRVPTEIRVLQKQLESKNVAIKNLIDRIENGSKITDLDTRLRQRLKERSEIQKQLNALNQSRRSKQEPPTEDWLRQRLNKLDEILKGDCPGSSLALSRLINGKIVVGRVHIDGRKRACLQGVFSLPSSSRVVNELGSSVAEVKEATTKKYVIDFVETPNLAANSEQAKSMLDQGMLQKQIATELGWSRAYVTKAIQFWYTSRNLEVPDGRSRSR